MALPIRSLQDEIFEVFERACREGDVDVAEHLLRALETMGRRQLGKKQLDRAYLTLASTVLRGGKWPARK
ncbi:hypothetical protein WL88_10745 [Burkholderia diffusa]|uniref:Uncharacterized protein n=1 Tax=Burkholderia diffusa TaxID=488732 RepID=A0AAW3PKT0_9BURK|nr:hypothetical protein WL85_02295 [Burkholderia diffusa]KWF31709.1 hypothetical protein WL86_02160 [Burkholderia diffusa]KWF39551.1 hypothetical protein WL87_07185 [Burkholderia diffusa]KWF57344.1 hypothetical protein WL88_10745 [Burkholderia diffusa]